MHRLVTTLLDRKKVLDGDRTHYTDFCNPLHLMSLARMVRESVKPEINRGRCLTSGEQLILHLQHDSGVFLYVALLNFDGRKIHTFLE